MQRTPFRHSEFQIPNFAFHIVAMVNKSTKQQCSYHAMISPFRQSPTFIALFSFACVLILSRAHDDATFRATQVTSSRRTCLALACPPPQRLKELLQSEMDGSRASETPILLPCCYDGLTARLVARAGFQATFMTGFGVSGVNGYPDTQLVSYQEMQQAAMSVAEGLSGAALELKKDPIPCIADGDTGYGNAVNAKRTVFGYARAGMAGIMIEDQVAPKRCGHVAGKSVVPFAEAVQRVKAACDARDEYESQFGAGTGPLILARTDALKTDGFEAAIERLLAFREVGCDMTFLEAPETIEQMQDYCSRVPGAKLANMLEQGSTPILPPQELKKMGYTLAAYPLTLLSASIKAMQESLERIQQGLPTDDLISSFPETKDAVGFRRYSEEEEAYRVD
jgi:2-methylisocitrate lyase-like PEP mutase family enzyme